MTPRAHAAAPRSRAGFSMLEIIGVVLLLGLIATMVTVNWRAMLPRAELNSSVRTLAAVLQSARSDAVSRNAEFQVQYDLDRERFRVVTPFRLGGGLAAVDEQRQALAWHETPKSVHLDRVVIDGVDIREGLAHVRFDPLGAASDHTVVLRQDPDDQYFTIEVLALTGLIRFHDGVFERPAVDEGDFQ